MSEPARQLDAAEASGIAKLRQLSAVWMHRAKKKFECADREETPEHGSRQLRHAANCEVNCAAELKDLCDQIDGGPDAARCAECGCSIHVPLCRACQCGELRKKTFTGTGEP